MLKRVQGHILPVNALLNTLTAARSNTDLHQLMDEVQNLWKLEFLLLKSYSGFGVGVTQHKTPLDPPTFESSVGNILQRRSYPHIFAKQRGLTV